jgi:hypothetical protein
MEKSAELLSTAGGRDEGAVVGGAGVSGVGISRSLKVVEAALDVCGKRTGRAGGARGPL